MLRTALCSKLTLFTFIALTMTVAPSVSVRASESSQLNLETFFNDVPVSNRSDRTKRRNTSESGTNGGCAYCSSMKRASEPFDDLAEIAEKTPKKQQRNRHRRIVPDYQDAPASRGPTPDSEVWSQFPWVKEYSDSKDVSTAIRIAKNRAKRASTGMCYKYVKDAIFNNEVKLTSERLVGNRVFPGKFRGDFGQTAVKNFKDECFIDLMSNPETKHLITSAASAPKGAIMIYRGGSRGGHIEIKTDYGAKADYVSDFKNSQSVLYNELQGRTSPSGRMTLAAVMVKDMSKKGQKCDNK